MPWSFVRVLLLLIVLVGLTLLIILVGQKLWLILLFLAAVIGFFWYLSTLVNLEKIAGDLRVPEGPVSSEELQLELNNQTEEREGGISGTFVYVTIVVVCLLLLLIIFRLMR